MFLRLKNNFRPIKYDGYFELFDNNSVDEYQIDKSQYQLLLSLNGCKTKKEILTEYEKDSQSTVKKFLRELERLGAIEKLPIAKTRIFPEKLPKIYLEAVLWDITSHCNLRCAHCYVSDYSTESKGRDLTTKEAFQAIDEMASMNVRDISLTGGEPVMRVDIKAIIRHIVNSNIRLAAIFTNGVAITQDFINFLKETVPNKYWVRHSLDGMTPESNAILRGDMPNKNEVFQKMTASIEMFVRSGLSVSVGTGVHRFNVNDIPKMYTFMKDLGITHWRLAMPKPLGRFQQAQKDIEADWKDIRKSYRKLIDIHLQEVQVIDGQIIAPIALEIEQVFFTELVTRTMNTFQKNDTACFYHKNRCAIKANGDIVPCSFFSDAVIGNVKYGSLKSAWENSKMQEIKCLCVEDVTECRNCLLIRECGTGCRAVAQKINGVITAKDPYACQQASFLKEDVMPLFKKHGFSLKMSERCREFE